MKNEVETGWTTTEPHVSRFMGPEVPQCPVCRTLMDGASSLKNPDAKPAPESLSVCAYCTAFLVYDTESKLRVLTADEHRSLHEDNRAELRKLALVLPKVRGSGRRTARAPDSARFLVVPRGADGFCAAVWFANDRLCLSKPYPKLKQARRAAESQGALLFESCAVELEGAFWIGIKFQIFGETQVLEPIGPYATLERLEAEQDARVRQAAAELGGRAIFQHRRGLLS